VVTCLKSADSLAHVMIAALLPYVKWTLEAKFGKVATSQVPKWFKPTAHLRAADAYWDPKEECVQNKSDDMLNVAMADEDGLYWEVEAVETLPAKRLKSMMNQSPIRCLWLKQRSVPFNNDEPIDLISNRWMLHHP